MDYRTIIEPATAEYVIERSRFLTLAAPVSDEAEAQAVVAAQRKKYFDARHHCSAWILGEDSSKQKSSDDGEPGGTAGMPILDVIKRKGLTNVVVVVTRYFGGIKLGAGGLVRAYSHSAALGLDAAKTAVNADFMRLAVAVAYPLLGSVENYLRQHNVRVADTSYADDVTFELLVPPDEVQALTDELTNLTAANAEIIELGTERLLLEEN